MEKPSGDWARCSIASLNSKGGKSILASCNFCFGCQSLVCVGKNPYDTSDCLMRFLLRQCNLPKHAVRGTCWLPRYVVRENVLRPWAFLPRLRTGSGIGYPSLSSFDLCFQLDTGALEGQFWWRSCNSFVGTGVQNLDFTSYACIPVASEIDKLSWQSSSMILERSFHSGLKEPIWSLEHR